jgi:hypothetical protein
MIMKSLVVFTVLSFLCNTGFSQRLDKLTISLRSETYTYQFKNFDHDQSRAFGFKHKSSDTFEYIIFVDQKVADQFKYTVNRSIELKKKIYFINGDQTIIITGVTERVAMVETSTSTCMISKNQIESLFTLK